MTIDGEKVTRISGADRLNQLYGDDALECALCGADDLSGGGVADTDYSAYPLCRACAGKATTEAI